MQPRPAHQLDRALLQIEIFCQYCLDVRNVRVLVHRAAKLDYPAELVAAAIIRVGQSELRVVLSGHGAQITKTLIG